MSILDLIPSIPYSPHAPSEVQAAALIAYKLVPDLDKPIEVGYGGAAGGGKSDWLLMSALEYVDEPGYAAILFRRTFAELALPGALMARARSWLRDTDAHWSDNDPPKTWTFPSGATVSFAYLATDADVERYQSAEFQFIGFDEATHFTEYQYTYLFSRLRRLESARVPLRMYSATNPGGVGHTWYKQRFVEPKETDSQRVFIPAKLWDNPHIDKDAYVMSLSNLTPTKRDQLLDGDWGAFEGEAFPDFDQSIHVVQPFQVPSDWTRFEMMDHGFNHPTAWYAAASDYDGNQVVFDGYYSPGLVSAHAPEILRRRSGEDYSPAWWARDDKEQLVYASCFADPSIRNKYGISDLTGRELSVEIEYGDYGIGFSPGQNDRRAGYLRVAEMIHPDPARVFPEWHPLRGQPDAPRLYVMRRPGTQELIEQLDTARVKAEGKDMLEVVDPDWESEHGHAIASLRYGMMSRALPSDRPKEEEPDPRVREARRMLKWSEDDGYDREEELSYA